MKPFGGCHHRRAWHKKNDDLLLIADVITFCFNIPILQSTPLACWRCVIQTLEVSFVRRIRPSTYFSACATDRTHPAREKSSVEEKTAWLLEQVCSTCMSFGFFAVWFV